MTSERDRNTPLSATLAGVLSRIQAGDRGENDPALRQRINEAFARHERRLRAHVAAELRGFSAEEVDDTVQEVLLVAWRKLPEHQGRSFRAWLFGIASHACANIRRKRRELLPGDDALFDASSNARTVYSRLRVEERERFLRVASARVLDAREQEVVYMRYELDLPREEIARLAGLADADEVRVVLQRTKRSLVRELESMLSQLGHGQSLLLSESVDG